MVSGLTREERRARRRGVCGPTEPAAVLAIDSSPEPGTPPLRPPPEPNESNAALWLDSAGPAVAAKVTCADEARPAARKLNASDKLDMSLEELIVKDEVMAG